MYIYVHRQRAIAIMYQQSLHYARWIMLYIAHKLVLTSSHGHHQIPSWLEDITPKRLAWSVFWRMYLSCLIRGTLERFETNKTMECSRLSDFNGERSEWQIVLPFTFQSSMPPQNKPSLGRPWKYRLLTNAATVARSVFCFRNANRSYLCTAMTGWTGRLDWKTSQHGWN